MNNLKTPELSMRILLGKEGFAEYRKTNRFWFFSLTAVLVVTNVLAATSINFNELELGLYIGALLFIYCIVIGILASKSKKNIFLWVVLAFISSSLLFLPSHLLMVRVGLKQEWL